RQLPQGFAGWKGGLSTAARMVVRYAHVLGRPSLASAHAGWKQYAVAIEATLRDGHLKLALSLAVEYSSTCPASAALSRQINAERFAEDFAAARPLSAEVVRDWRASKRGMAATPHAQRSRADVRVELKPAFDELPVAALVDLLEEALGTPVQIVVKREDEPAFDELPVAALVDLHEEALGTPVQTAVKREDEQAFAELNAANLMFCEDAARRVAAALSADPRVDRFDATVAHYESLHPHDAVA